MKLLHLDSSILGDNSVSRQLTASIVARIEATSPGIEIATRDLAADPIPHLTLAGLPAADASSRAVLDEFLAADIVVIGAPMYNFSIPSQLKAWIDRITVAGETFRYTEAGPEGLIGGKRIIVAISRGGHYGPGLPTESFEHLETYLRSLFGFLGAVPEVIAADGIALGPDARAASVEAALGTVSALAA